MEGYSVEILEVIGKELSHKERVMLKDTSTATPLDSVVGDNDTLTLDVDFFALLHVKNEKAKGDKEYRQCVIYTKSGDRYYTGSESFTSALKDIWDEMCECEEEWGILIYRLPSKNFKDKTFLTCSVV